jgi:hypothetical protein
MSGFDHTGESLLAGKIVKPTEASPEVLDLFLAELQHIGRFVVSVHAVTTPEMPSFHPRLHLLSLELAALSY